MILNAILKLCEISGINLKSDPFFRATLSLTVQFALIIIVLLVSVYFLDTRLFDAIEERVTASASCEGLETARCDGLEDYVEMICFIIMTFMMVVIISVVSFILARKALKPTHDAYEKQRRFVGDVAHEFRTPLTVIKTGVESSLGESASDDERKSVMADVKVEVDDLSVLVDDLLFLAQGQIIKRKNFETFDLSRLVTKQVAVMQQLAQRSQVELSSDVDSDISMHGNPHHVKRLVVNLVKNAINYNREGGSVVVTLRKMKGETLLRIEDTGIGIAQGDLPKIAERFYKADESRSERVGGAGLGLSIVQDIVSKHDCNISFESMVGEGTVVSLVIPQV